MAPSTDHCTGIELVAVALRFVISGIFVLAASLKVLRRTDLLPVARALGFSAGPLVIAALRLLPVAEFALGILLFLGIWVQPALFMLFLLLLGFTAALFVLMRRGYRGGCACFGTIDEDAVGIVQVSRNSVLLVLTAFVLLQSFGSVCIGKPVWMLPILVPTSALGVLIVAAGSYVLASEVELFVRRVGR